MGAMHGWTERLSSAVTPERAESVRPAVEFLQRSIRGKIGLGIGCQETCDKAASAAAVMLHLRSCYVSKAAILTALVQLVPVENRSPS